MELEAMRVNARVKDVMSTRVVAVRRTASFKEMAARLHRHGVSAFPVLDEEGKVVGVVSEADLLTKEAFGDSAASAFSWMTRRRDQVKADGATAAELMSTPPVTIGPDESVEHAAWLMYARGVKRLPVTRPDGRLIGIVTRSDVLSVFDRKDEEIRREIREGVLRRKFLCNPNRFTVTIKDGVVTIEGTPEATDVGLDIIAEAKHVQGVVAVRDRLSYPSGDPHVPDPLV